MYELVSRTVGNQQMTIAVFTDIQLADIAYKKNIKYYAVAVDPENVQATRNIFAMIAANNASNVTAQNWDYRIPINIVSELVQITAYSETEILAILSTAARDLQTEPDEVIELIYDIKKKYPYDHIEKILDFVCSAVKLENCTIEVYSRECHNIEMDEE